LTELLQNCTFILYISQGNLLGDKSMSEQANNTGNGEDKGGSPIAADEVNNAMDNAFEGGADNIGDLLGDQVVDLFTPQGDKTPDNQEVIEENPNKEEQVTDTQPDLEPKKESSSEPKEGTVEYYKQQLETIKQEKIALETRQTDRDKRFDEFLNRYEKESEQTRETRRKEKYNQRLSKIDVLPDSLTAQEITELAEQYSTTPDNVQQQFYIKKQQQIKQIKGELLTLNFEEVTDSKLLNEAMVAFGGKEKIADHIEEMEANPYANKAKNSILIKLGQRALDHIAQVRGRGQADILNNKPDSQEQAPKLPDHRTNRNQEPGKPKEGYKDTGDVLDSGYFDQVGIFDDSNDPVGNALSGIFSDKGK
jgi:hypothetical protein